MAERKRVLITGASGLIGTVLRDDGYGQQKSQQERPVHPEPQHLVEQQEVGTITPMRSHSDGRLRLALSRSSIGVAPSEALKLGLARRY